MFSRFSRAHRHTTSELALILDIGSGSVGAALVLLSRTHLPTILYTTRSDIPFQKGVQGARLHSLMLRTLAHVMLAVAAEGLAAGGFVGRRPVITEAVIALSAPWTVSKTAFLHLNQKEPLPITERVLAKLLEHETETSAAPQGGNVRIEEKLIKVTLNGYETGAPFGKAVTDALFSVFSSFSPPTLVRGIEDAVVHSLHIRRITFSSFSLMAFAALRDLFPLQEQFLLMDVSGEMTELSIVKKQVLLESITFPSGKNNLLRSVHTETGVPVSGAQTFLKLHVEGRAAGKLSERGVQALGSAQELWLRHFTGALATFSEEVFLPREVFLTCDEDISSVFINIIKSGDIGKLTFTSEPFNVHIVDTEMLSQSVRWNGEAVYDPFLALETVFSNTIRR